MPTTAEYDADEIAGRLTPWLTEKLGRPVEITSLTAPGESGFSSETMLVDLTTDAGEQRLVVKSRPLGFTVFPTYEMDWQYQCMDIVGRVSDVPVPTMRWYEADEKVLGRDFYVMDRVDGVVPTDNPPYTIGGFLFEASPADQRRLFDSSLETISALHRIEWEPAGLGFLDRAHLGARGLTQQLAYYDEYLPFATGGEPNAPLEDVREWLYAHRPAHDDLVLNWGDARIGNIMYRDFEPVAVLDWEMATLGPPEVDVAWFLYFPRFFSSGVGLPQLEGFPTTEDGAAYYESVAGRPLRDLDWYLVWAGYRYAVILVRMFHKIVAEGEMPEGWTFEDNPMVQLMLDVRAESGR